MPLVRKGHFTNAKGNYSLYAILQTPSPAAADRLPEIGSIAGCLAKPHWCRYSRYRHAPGHSVLAYVRW